MHLSTAFITLLLALANHTITVAAQAASDHVTTVPPPPRYHLQTKVEGKHEDCGSNKNDLFLTSYHTGAGLGDATLVSNKTQAWVGYLNDTQQLFASNIGPWPLAVYWGSYQAFGVVTISIAGSGADSGFYFNETGLQFNGSTGGWLACDWWHGVAQIFNVNGYFRGPLPNSCSKVNLLPVAVEAAPAY